MMRWCVFLMLFLGTSVSAQSIDQRKLTECITEANEILEFADAWRQTLEAKGERASSWDTASFYRLREMDQVLRDTFARLENNEAHEDIMKAMEAAADPLFLRERLIKAMIQEAYDSSGEYTEIAVFVSQCATNYGGELFTLEDEIADLRKEITQLKQEKGDIEELLIKEKGDVEKRLNKRIQDLEERYQMTVADYRQTIEAADEEIQNKERRDNLLELYAKRNANLCMWAQGLKHSSVLKTQVIVNGEFYNLCD